MPIYAGASILMALKQMDAFLIVINEEKSLCLISEGDIKRVIIKN